MSRGVARATGVIAAATALSRLLGFVRWLVFAGAVGAGTVGSAYSSANSVPNVLYEVAAGGALAAAVVPLVSAALADDRRDHVDTIASTVLTWTLVVLVPLAVLLWLVADPVAAALVPATGAGGRPATELTATMLRWFAPQVPLYGIGIVAAGVLQAHRRFVAAALAPLLSSLVVIGTYLAYGAVRPSSGMPSPTAVAVLAGGTTLGVVALSLPLLAPLRAAGVRLRPSLRLPEGLGSRVRSLAAAGVVGLLAQQVAVLATIRVANAGGADGALNVYQYAQAVYLLPYAVLVVPVATAVFPDLAAGAHLDVASAAPRLAGSLRTIAVAAALGTAGLLAAAPALGRFFAAIDASRHGERVVDVGAAMTATTIAFAPGLLGFGLAALLTRALYVRGRPRLASTWVGAGWLVAALVPLALALHESDPVRRLVVIGLASSAGMTLAAAGLLAAVRSAWPGTALAGLGRTIAGSVVAAAAGGAVGAGVDRLLPAGGGAVGAVGVGVLAGGVAVAVVLAVLAVLDRSAVSALATRLRRVRA